MIRRRRFKKNEIIEVPQEEILLNENSAPGNSSGVILPNEVPPNEAKSENNTTKDLFDYINSLEVCIECTRPLLENEKKAEYECGCHKVHFKCALQGAYNSMRDRENFLCVTCGVVLFGDKHKVNTDEDANILVENLNNMKKSKGFKTDLRVVKTKHASFNKASAVFKKLLAQEFKKYENLVTASILTIQAAKKAAISSIKQTDEYKNASKASVSATSSCNRFKTKYNLGWQESRILKIAAITHWRRFRSRPTSLIQRKFRLRI